MAVRSPSGETQLFHFSAGGEYLKFLRLKPGRWPGFLKSSVAYV